MKIFKLISLTLLCLVFNLSIFAEDKKENSGNKATYEQNTVIDFEDAELEGEYLSPDSSSIQGENNLYFDSMLETPSFQEKLKRSPGAIR